MKNNMKTFENLLQNKNTISKKELDSFFDTLQSIESHELKGFWHGGFFPTGSGVEIFIKDFLIIKWIGKKFDPPNKVRALIFKFITFKFNLPFFGSASLQSKSFRGKKSAAIKYNHLPIIDYLRKVDSSTEMGVMEMNGKTKIYFYLQK
jgi:hypothetical protein